MASAFGKFGSVELGPGRLSRSVALAIALQIMGAAPVRAQGAELEAVPGTPTDSSAVASEGDEASATQGSNTVAPWYERLQFSGDFRARYEGFYQRWRQTRNRARLRLRLRVDTEINEDVRFQLQVASGDPGNAGLDKPDLYQLLPAQAVQPGPGVHRLQPAGGVGNDARVREIPSHLHTDADDVR